MEKLYSVIHSTLVLCLFLGILLLGRTTMADREQIAQPKTLAQENKWEGLEISPPFSWPTMKEMVGLNLLPVFKEKAPKVERALHQPVSYTSQYSPSDIEKDMPALVVKSTSPQKYLQ